MDEDERLVGDLEGELDVLLDEDDDHAGLVRDPADDGQQELQALISDLVGSGPFELQQYSEDINAHVAKYPQHREQLVKAWETVAAEAN